MHHNNPQRYVATRTLSNMAVTLVHVHHELWRVANQESEGLSKKEMDAVLTITADLDAARQRLSWLHEQLRISDQVAEDE